MQVLLSKAERDYLTGKRQFDPGYACTINRLQKKLERFNSEQLPILAKHGYLTEFCKLAQPNPIENRKVSNNYIIRKETEKTSRSDINIMFESEAHTETELLQDSVSGSELRGSPSPAVTTGGNLVGRGIANPMSERTRGFELLS